MQNSMEIPQKIKNITTIRSSNSILCFYLKKTKPLIQEDICTPMLIVALFTYSQEWKQSNNGMNTMEYYLPITKK